jgi:hypothetical protein
LAFRRQAASCRCRRFTFAFCFFRFALASCFFSEAQGAFFFACRRQAASCRSSRFTFAFCFFRFALASCFFSDAHGGFFFAAGVTIAPPSRALRAESDPREAGTTASSSPTRRTTPTRLLTAPSQRSA